jgi:TolA-binding protein
MAAELLCLRGESLLRTDRSREAAEVFEVVTREHPASPYVPQALFGIMQARDAKGDSDAAAVARDRLLGEFSQTPWAARALAGAPPGTADRPRR